MSNRFAPFVARHIGPREDEIRQMLSILGYGSLDELTQAVVPSSICSREEAGLADAVSEEEALQELRSIASQNRVLRSFIGQGYYGTHTPNVIKRNVLENPAWYTAYTPYQPEISQGRLELLFYFQTMVSELTGLEIANCSLLDEATAAAEAMALCHRNSKGSANRFVVSSNCHPQTIEVVQTRAQPLGLEVEVVSSVASIENWDGVFGVLVQYPGSDGVIESLDSVITLAHSRQAWW